MGSIPGGWELVLILLVVVVVFGSKRLPDSARALGRSMRILKAETKGLRDDDAAPTTSTSTTTAQQVAAAPVPPVQVDPVAPGSAAVVPPATPQGEQAPHKHL